MVLRTQFQIPPLAVHSRHVATKPFWWWGGWKHWIVFITSLYMYYALCFVHVEHSVCHKAISVLIYIYIYFIYIFIFTICIIHTSYVCMYMMRNCRRLLLINCLLVILFFAKKISFFLKNIWQTCSFMMNFNLHLIIYFHFIMIQIC